MSKAMEGIDNPVLSAKQALSSARSKYAKAYRAHNNAGGARLTALRESAIVDDKYATLKKEYSDALSRYLSAIAESQGVEAAVQAVTTEKRWLLAYQFPEHTALAIAGIVATALTLAVKAGIARVAIGAVGGILYHQTVERLDFFKKGSRKYREAKRTVEEKWETSKGDMSFEEFLKTERVAIKELSKRLRNKKLKKMARSSAFSFTAWGMTGLRQLGLDTLKGILEDTLGNGWGDYIVNGDHLHQWMSKKFKSLALGTLLYVSSIDSKNFSYISAAEAAESHSRTRDREGFPVDETKKAWPSLFYFWEDDHWTTESVYNAIAERDGFFAVKVSGTDTYNIYKIDPNGRIRLAFSSVTYPTEFSEQSGVIVFEQDELKLMSKRHSTFIEQTNNQSRSGKKLLSQLSEEELKGRFTLEDYPDDELSEEYYDRLMRRTRSYLMNNPEVAKRLGFTGYSFDQLFTVGKSSGALSNEDLTLLATILFDDVNSNSKSRYTHVEVDSSDPRNPRLTVHFRPPNWRDFLPEGAIARTNTIAHEIGHALHCILRLDDLFNELPAAERARMFNELLKNSESLGLDGHVSSSDHERLADFIMAYLTEPERVRKECPTLCKFLDNAIKNNPALSKIIKVN
ncbi:MAG: hypothetical protein RLZZ283_279 [Candidatus Parcubacteria bacterium]|jgi:hypothetical protein